LHIKNRDMRPETLNQLDGLLPVFSLGDYRHLVVFAENVAYAFPNHRVVIREKHAYLLCHNPSPTLM